MAETADAPPPLSLVPDCIGPATGVTDAKVTAIAREWMEGGFTTAEGTLVREILEAGLRVGYSLVWTDVLAGEPE